MIFSVFFHLNVNWSLKVSSCVTQMRSQKCVSIFKWQRVTYNCKSIAYYLAGSSPQVIVANTSLVNSANGPLGRSNTDPARQQMRRTRHSNILDISNTDSLPSYNLDEEVVGIITMEDVMEELLQVSIIF